ncbi:diaminopimelate epimerase [Paenibacillus sp. FSL H7-0326]|uniref:diaminopimelate epimerase n=1 Tax=unclassified Paenibacillus TaxID=185978 RepID=UPI00273D481B|nr:diaminopimelate epimerase [Paenibacillus sp. FSL H7-0326]
MKCNPTQNMTVLVQTDHGDRNYETIATQIMSYDSIHAEQVGFIEQPTGSAAAYLHMAGGEFCGNACMSLAAYIVSKKGIGFSEEGRIILESSGTEQLIDCLVMRNGDLYTCELNMPIPHHIEPKTIHIGGQDYACFLVRYGDSIHLIMEIDEISESIRNSAQMTAQLMGLAGHHKLIGILLYEPENYRMTPLIHVPKLGSMIWERGCGSGTASIGAYLAWRNNTNVDIEVIQPGGLIKVHATYNNGLTSVAIKGNVEIVAEGRAYIDG